MSNNFIHLGVHTEYSLIDSVVRIKALLQAVKQQAMPAVALTDHSNLFALVKFYKAALASGIKPLIGADVWVKDTDNTSASRMLLLCQDNLGYHNLSTLLSKSYLEGQQQAQPLLEKSWIEKYQKGLLAIAGGTQSDIGRALIADKAVEARQKAKDWQTIFPNRFYLALHRYGQEHEEKYIGHAVELAHAEQLPVVAINDVRFITAEAFEAHEARVCIHDSRTLDDPRRPRAYSDQQYLKSSTEMQELFADIPEAIENTIQIAKRCNLNLRLGESFLPDFPVPEGQTIESYFIAQSRLGLEQRLAVVLAKRVDESVTEDEITKQYQQRLESEIEVITAMGFPGYFLIVADFIHWAKQNGVPVGPGRGSGAGSLVAYALEITDLDPIEYDLLFERFLNPERVSLPDFDIDFCMEGRDRVIEYVAEKYGRDKVSQIITYGTMAAKAVVRDVGRVLGHPYGFVDNIAKQIPFELGMTLTKALEESEDLHNAYKNDEEVTALLDMALSLEGLTRNVGKHAGGVVIAPSSLTDFTPLYCEQDGSSLVTQLDKDDVESVGLVKFDFLGLRTLTIIDWALKNINQRLRAESADAIDINNIPLDDGKTFDLLCAQATTAVFQLESRGMKDLIKRLQPDSFDDIIALVALFRPGPLQSGMVDDFIARKHGEAEIEYPHPALEPILNSTYGVILYQEQVMQIAQVLGGYTLGGADLLRRAMGKKKPEEMAKQREIFLQGAVKNNVDKDVATYIFDLMEKFAGYGFNKSHSAAYALLSYQTAWLKAHYPAEFMASVLSADMDNTDKIVRLIDECNQLKIEVIPPDVNVSSYKFSVDEKSRIVYGLGAIKGLGAAAIDAVQMQRQASGNYQDLFDFCQRIDTQKLNKRSLEAMIRSGAMDSLQQNRATLMATLPSAIKFAEQHQRDSNSGQVDIFMDFSSDVPLTKTEYITKSQWSDLERLTAEKETLGLYLTGHPINQYKKELLNITNKRIIDHIEKFESKNTTPRKESRFGNELEVRLAGLLINIRTKNTRSGKMAFLVLDDCSARIDVLIRPDDFQGFLPYLEKDKVLVVEGGLSADDFSGGYRLRAKQIYNIQKARECFAKGLEIKVSNQQTANGFVKSLTTVLDTQKTNNKLPVWISYGSGSASARLRLGESWKIQPSEQLLSRLEALAGAGNVRLLYH